ncbi:MAG: UDP-N-acetylmuramate dehydrogenase [Syntrophorhabdaceae bacterium]|nr:UDP-N-acetylmuramate dehydrogenase [Syntrophorhabdaceae bacterium]
MLRNVDVTLRARLKDYTTIGIGGTAERMVFPHSIAEVGEIFSAERRAGGAVRVLGAGSNLLVSDNGVRGTTLCTKKHLSKVAFLGGCSVIAEAGVMLPRLAVLCALSNLSGIEPISGIPGTVGGALMLNAGAYGRRIGDLVEWVEIVDDEGELHRVEAQAIWFGYRETAFPVRGVVVRAGFRFAEGTRETVFEHIRRWNEKRRANQPWDEKSFGCAFRNPQESESAGALLERAGMKGEREGDACFSEKHANFLLNRGKAAAADVYKLMNRGIKAVEDRFGVLLAPEVRMWGDFDA